MKATVENFSPEKAADAMLREMIIKFGVKFMSDFDDVKLDNPLYVALYDNGGEIKPTPMFPRRDIAVYFVDLCRKNLPGFKKKKFRIYKLTAA